MNRDYEKLSSKDGKNNLTRNVLVLMIVAANAAIYILRL